MKMGFRDLQLRLKVFRFRRLVLGDGRRKNKKKKPSWLTPVSHGYHTVDRFRECCTGCSSDADSVLVQREQIEEVEIWFFGVSDAQIGSVIAKYMQTHLFDRLPNEYGIMRKSKETMRRAYMSVVGTEKERICGSSAASVMVVNGEKLVIASMGDHRVVICSDGDAHHVATKNLKSSKRHWFQMIFPACNKRQMEDELDPRNYDLAVVTERINSDAEFIIIGSSGIWEAMKNQEAVNLIRHIEDPQQAAQCLAKEALNRLSKNIISCIVIRFD